MKSAARRVRGRNDMHSKYEAAIRHATYFMSGDLQRSRQYAGPIGGGTEPARQSRNGAWRSHFQNLRFARFCNPHFTHAAHSSSTNMSNLPAYDSRKFTISLSSVAYALEELGNRFLTIFWLSQHAFDGV